MSVNGRNFLDISKIGLLLDQFFVTPIEYHIPVYSTFTNFLFPRYCIPYNGIFDLE